MERTQRKGSSIVFISFIKTQKNEKLILIFFFFFQVIKILKSINLQKELEKHNNNIKF